MSKHTIRLVGGGVLLTALVIGIFSAVSAMVPAVMGAWGAGPMMGGSTLMAGPGMMGGGGIRGMGGGGMLGQVGPAQPIGSLEEAEDVFKSYLQTLANEDLVLKEVMAFENNHYAIVKERSTGEAAFELLADNRTSAVFPEPGPNMMWNTEYGHMGGSGGWLGGMMGGAWLAPSSEAMAVGPERAQQLAQAWLGAHLPGSTAGSPDAFPGYYTLHVEQDQGITGMLSVNAASGQVWYHNWHGPFVGALEAEH